MICINKNVLENTQINNNFLNNFDIEKLWDEWLLEIENNIYLNVQDIEVKEIRYFFNILSNVFSHKTKKFIKFYMDEMEQRYNKNKKEIFKFDIDNIIDKYLTNEIKAINKDVYNKYMVEKTRYGYINHKKIILLIDEYILPPDNDGAFNIMYLTYKNNLTNIYFLSALYKGYYDPKNTLNEYKLLEEYKK